MPASRYSSTVKVCAGNSSLGTCVKTLGASTKIACPPAGRWYGIPYSSNFSQIFYLANTGFKIIKFGVFIQADGKCIHISAIHTAISKVTLELYAESFAPSYQSCRRVAINPPIFTMPSFWRSLSYRLQGQTSLWLFPLCSYLGNLLHVSL